MAKSAPKVNLRSARTPCGYAAAFRDALRANSGEQALAVLEGLQVLREAVWIVYGRQAQQAWRDQLMPDHSPPDFDPDLLF
jgi:hypothetical protein